MANYDAPLIGAMFHLSNAAPEQWETFKKEFEIYTQRTCQDAIRSHVDVALVAQGRAQSILQLNDIVKDLRAKFEHAHKR